MSAFYVSGHGVNRILGGGLASFLALVPETFTAVNGGTSLQPSRHWGQGTSVRIRQASHVPLTLEPTRSSRGLLATNETISQKSLSSNITAGRQADTRFEAYASDCLEDHAEFHFDLRLEVRSGHRTEG